MSPWLIFWFKKIVALFFYPVPLAFMLLVAACVMLWMKKRERVARILVTVAVGILFVCGLSPLPTMLIRPVERGFEPVLTPSEPFRSAPSCAVFVLGAGGINTNPDYPMTLRVSPWFWRRLLEGSRLHRLLPQSRLIVSLPGESPVEAKEEFIGEVAGLFGLDRDRIVIITEALTTADEARLANEQLNQDEPCFLVTEALHMRRAKQIFEDAGIEITPAPCGYVRPENPDASVTILDFVPSAGNLGATRGGTHEALGYLWQKITPGREREE